MNPSDDVYKSPCGILLALGVVGVAALGCVATAAWPPAPAALRYCGGVVVLVTFIIALAWAMRGKK